MHGALCFSDGCDVGGGGSCGFDMDRRESYAATIGIISYFLILGRIGPCRSEVSMDPLGTVEALLTCNRGTRSCLHLSL